MHLLEESFANAVLITGLVVVMMMMIEMLNLGSKGRFFSSLSRSRAGGVLAGALLGALPGCMGGFATVSLYTHGMLTFGALVAMMIASSGDEAFVMLATMPDKALWIFGILLAVGIAAGLLVDVLVKKRPAIDCGKLEMHEADTHGGGRHFGWKRIIMLAGVGLFIAALGFGLLEHDHGAVEHKGGLNLLSEDWMNVLFAILGLGVLAGIALLGDHFVEEHLWHHVVLRHLPRVFAWTFGTLLLLGIGLHHLDLENWISDNTVLMILLATAVGIIPESGPHLIFVTLYASGIVPLPVLLASCISQDGHASLPLLAESKSGFLRAKAINCIVALIVGFASLLFV